MDERPMEAMREAIKVIKAADPEFKITLAGNYHEEIQGDLYYLSIPYGNQFPEEVKAERERKGQISTVYTRCTELSLIHLLSLNLLKQSGRCFMRWLEDMTVIFAGQ